MNNPLRIIAFLFLSSLIFSCTKKEDHYPSSSCNTSSSDLQTLFSILTLNGYTQSYTMEAEIHAYTFRLQQGATVCKIGCQSTPALEDTSYLIEIIDSTTNNLIYSGSHRFSANITSYATPDSTIQLQAGTSYTIRRIQTHWGSTTGNTVGRIIRKNTMEFPYTSGNMLITSSDFYQNGGPYPNQAIPLIDLIFKE